MKSCLRFVSYLPTHKSPDEKFVRASESRDSSVIDYQLI